MSHFYGTVEGNARSRATRQGSKNGGLVTHAAGWNGAIKVIVFHDEERNEDRYVVQLVPWGGAGHNPQLIAEGVLDASRSIK